MIRELAQSWNVETRRRVSETSIWCLANVNRNYIKSATYYYYFLNAIRCKEPKG